MYVRFFPTIDFKTIKFTGVLRILTRSIILDILEDQTYTKLMSY